MPAPLNIAACLVHESWECIVDMLQNIHYFSPDTVVILYNGSADPDLLPPDFPYHKYNAVLYPDPKPIRWGRLHDYVFDCLEYAIENYRFTSFTTVDSDQLICRHGYTKFIAQYFLENPDVGLLGSCPERIVQTERFGPARSALMEKDLWMPLLEKFEDGPQKFVYWSFWPSTVFSYQAARGIVETFKNEVHLQAILQKTHIIATEEVLFPTLTALLGFRVAQSPFSRNVIRFRIPITLEDLRRTRSLLEENFWLHPVIRKLDDEARQFLRVSTGNYDAMPRSPSYRKSQNPLRPNYLGQAGLIIAHQRDIAGWLSDEEAALLISAVTKIATRCEGKPTTIVEVGAYCGKATVTMGLALRFGEAEGTIYAVDLFDGRTGAHDGTITEGLPTLEAFEKNIAESGLEDRVEIICSPSCKVHWERPIDFLLIDGFHDYPNVARDFYHFARWLSPGSFVAFHDYAPYYPGVCSFVDELLVEQEFELAGRAGTLVILEKLPRKLPGLVAPISVVSSNESDTMTLLSENGR